MQNPSKFDHKLIEEGIYNFWKENKFFEDLNSSKPPFSIMMPPPNVTGHLHLGHAWDDSLQDTIIRYKKLKGFNTIWIPGTDHAGIATQTKYEKLLEAKGVDKSKLSRNEFINQIFDWSKSQASYIRNQWAKLGLAVSYDNEVFTLDEHVRLEVKKAFVNLYKNKLIYQSYKLVNWDVKLQTAISDIETVFKPAHSKLYYFKYFIEGSNEFLPVATTRPETMFVDTNVFVNPKDKRYKKYIGKYAINPINNEKLKILVDEYIDIKFGTGAMKCTPAHDANDYELANKHNIKNYNSVIEPDGKLNSFAKSVTKNFSGIDRLKARDAIVEEMASRGMLIKTEEYDNEVGYSERTGEVVEHILSKQWFVKMKPIVDHLNKIQKSSKNKYSFIPARFNKTLNTWLKNINDWCISRQLVWGHQIPVWYKKNSKEIYVGINPPKDINNYIQESSVLDTWFSSGLWPIVTTYENHKNLEKFFPISVLVTAYDILFFWVARMLFQCTTINDTIPIKKILIHGLIRDNQNRKMSKSLGNGVDPMEVIDQSGADALRMFLTSTASLGEDLRYDQEKIKFYSNFFNKIWNVKNFIANHELTNVQKPKSFNLINSWILSTFNKYLKAITTNMDKFNFVVANKYLIEFIWDIFCNQYIEFIKPSLNDHEFKHETIWTTHYIFKNVLIALHPHAPFLTENIYCNLYHDKKSIMQEDFPKQFKVKCNTKHAQLFIDIFNAIKDLRIKYSIKNINKIDINVLLTKPTKTLEINKFLNQFNINILNTSKARVNLDWDLISIKDFAFEWKNTFVDKQKVKEELTKKLKFLESEIKRSETILSNKNFIAKAPKAKIDSEKQKYDNYKHQFAEVKKELDTTK